MHSPVENAVGVGNSKEGVISSSDQNADAVIFRIYRSGGDVRGRIADRSRNEDGGRVDVKGFLLTCSNHCRDRNRRGLVIAGAHDVGRQNLSPLRRILLFSNECAGRVDRDRDSILKRCKTKD